MIAFLLACPANVTRQTSTTYNPFMYLSLPIPPPSRGGKVALQACLDALVNKEVMTGSEAWLVFHVSLSFELVYE